MQRIGREYFASFRIAGVLSSIAKGSSDRGKSDDSGRNRKRITVTISDDRDVKRTSCGCHRHESRRVEFVAIRPRCTASLSPVSREWSGRGRAASFCRITALPSNLDAYREEMRSSIRRCSATRANSPTRHAALHGRRTSRSRTDRR